MATSTKSSSSDSKGSKNRTIPIVGIVFAVVAVILVAAVVFTGNDNSDVPPEEEYGTPEVTGSLPPYVDPASDGAVIGMAAPEASGTDFDDAPVEISNDGEAKAIVFLAHWCPHCQEEVPEVQEWLDDTGGVEGVAMYSVSTSMDPVRPNWAASEWLEEEGWTVPVLRDDEIQTVLASFGGTGFPYWVFVNSDGTVAGRISGNIPTAQLEEILTTLT